MSKDKSKMMDPGMPEGEAPDRYRPNERMPYAMEQLIAEVADLTDSDVPYQESNRNQRGVAFDVQFDTSLLDSDTREMFGLLMGLLVDPAHNNDDRIKHVDVDEQDGVLVSFANNVQVMDDRTPFGLADAWAVMNGDDL